MILETEKMQKEFIFDEKTLGKPKHCLTTKNDNLSFIN